MLFLPTLIGQPAGALPSVRYFDNFSRPGDPGVNIFSTSPQQGSCTYASLPSTPLLHALNPSYPGLLTHVNGASGSGFVTSGLGLPASLTVELSSSVTNDMAIIVRGRVGGGDSIWALYVGGTQYIYSYTFSGTPIYTVLASAPITRPSGFVKETVVVTPTRVEHYLNDVFTVGVDTTYAAGGQEIGLYNNPGTSLIDYLQVIA